MVMLGERVGGGVFSLSQLIQASVRIYYVIIGTIGGSILATRAGRGLDITFAQTNSSRTTSHLNLH